MVQGVCMSGSAQEDLSGIDIEQLRPRYRVEEDLDPEQASESMMPLENLASGEAPKEWSAFQMEEPESGADLESEIH